MNKQSATVTPQGDSDLLIERVFDAPAHLVWRAATEPDLIRRWWGANRAEVTHVEVDLRVGGKWRYVSKLPDGSTFAFYGEYRQIDPGRSVTQTETFEAFPDDPSLNTMTLEELGDGRTQMRVLCRYNSPEGRAAVIASGMEAGMQDAYDLLEDAARSLA
ncbi:MAG: hypothetical protein QOI98_2598 [Solirubrobacteraceae bacterium]|jgi:uncharacterized protein YndB with AHSA1/START domain|nr:hypothetical protein [Solirubrobacteraceae bacterium]